MIQTYLLIILLTNKKSTRQLHSLYLSDFASSYVGKKAVDIPIEPDDIESYTVPVSNIDSVELI